jgi:molybdopterin-containing oxidoreductase family membrane subunit
VAEIKHILKKSGENYKKNMYHIEKEGVDEFYHETHANHH